MKDKLGQEITVGSIIAYGHSYGRSTGMAIGKVLSLEILEDRLYDSHHIRVIGISDFWGDTPKLNLRPGTLIHPDRIIVLADSQVPENYRQLLDSWRNE